MKILISAAETSSDAHGAELLRALRTLSVGEVEAFGVGGPKLEAAGLKTIVDARELLAMGFFEVFSRLPRIFSALKEVTAASASERPDVAVVIDYPEFHFRLARRLRKQGVPVIYYIPPKVWVWRKKRMQVLKERFARVLSILPFEKAVYEKAGVPISYVGSPLMDELPLKLTRSDARRELNIPDEARVLVLMPGSRPAEIRRHVDLMLEAVIRAAAFLRNKKFLGAKERLIILIPFPVTSELTSAKARVSSWMEHIVGERGDHPDFVLDVRVSQGNAPECMVAADAGLIKSGTSTLEAAMLNCPHAVVYKPNFVTEWLFKHLVRYKGPVGLSNLVAGWKPGDKLAFNEILCSEATPLALANEVVSLFMDLEKRGRLRVSMAEVYASISTKKGTSNDSPSAAAAREVLEVIQEQANHPRALK